MAKYFDRQGFRVFAGCLVSDGDGAKDLLSTCSERLKVVQLDVTEDEQVQSALTTVKEDLGGEGRLVRIKFCCGETPIPHQSDLFQRTSRYM